MTSVDLKKTKQNKTVLLTGAWWNFWDTNADMRPFGAVRARLCHLTKASYPVPVSCTPFSPLSPWPDGWLLFLCYISRHVPLILWWECSIFRSDLSYTHPLPQGLDPKATSLTQTHQPSQLPPAFVLGNTHRTRYLPIQSLAFACHWIWRWHSVMPVTVTVTVEATLFSDSAVTCLNNN